MTIFSAVFSAMYLVLISGCGANQATNTTAPKNIANAGPTAPVHTTDAAPIKVTVTELYRAYMEDKTKESDLLKTDKHKADAVYKDKTVLISGAVYTTAKDLMTKREYVSLKPDDPNYVGFFQIQIFLTDAETPKIEKLNEGEQITVLGKCVGVKGGNIIIKDGVLQ